MTILTATYEAEEDCELPAFKGSTLRGALGHSLIELACHRPAGTVCAPHVGEGKPQCVMPNHCGYGAIFEAEKGARGDKPVPYVFQPALDSQEQFQEGDRLQTGFILFGHAYAWLPWIVWALGRMGPMGLGGEHAPWLLAELDASQADGRSVSLLDSFDHCPILSAGDLLSVMPPFHECQIEFLTPTQIVRDGAVTIELDGATLVRRLLRRMGDILETFCHLPATPEYYRQLDQLAGNIRTTNRNLRLFHWERFSSRQKQRHGLPGLLGSMNLEEIPDEIAPLLWLGQWLHVGKAPAFGLGRYRLNTVC